MRRGHREAQRDRSLRVRGSLEGHARAADAVRRIGVIGAEIECDREGGYVDHEAIAGAHLDREVRWRRWSRNVQNIAGRENVRVAAKSL